uniref:Large ribosomal subunit protein uL4c n=1 Tax=Choreocolax polysiphoniae TaxID=282351 RepID=A0A0B5VQH8_9FLOR|nr:50S ribosomal protein L4 [Choreocolax polysiphoniae]AJH65867.1 50S ribosomal protein L4 [Choreocolax polysiphoniae]
MSIIKQISCPIIYKNNIINSKLLYLIINNNLNKRMYLVHKSLKQDLTHYRIRNVHTKNKSEVRGGGKKPWRQKGTGRSRAGSNRSPLWKGGGVIFGPKKKIYKSKLNKQEKKIAINIALYNKANNIFIINEILIKPEKPYTKQAIKEINKLGIYTKNKKNILLVINKKTNLLNLSFKNLIYVKLIEVMSMNILVLLKADIILFTKSALKKINK